MRSLGTEEKETELHNALHQIKYDILGLSEVRRMGEAIIEKMDGDLYCYKGETRGQRGVGFIIKKHLKQNVLEVNGISERIMVLSLLIKGEVYTIIQVYAPTEARPIEEAEGFYNL